MPQSISNLKQQTIASIVVCFLVFTPLFSVVLYEKMICSYQHPDLDWIMTEILFINPEPIDQISCKLVFKLNDKPTKPYSPETFTFCDCMLLDGNVH